MSRTRMVLGLFGCALLLGAAGIGRSYAEARKDANEGAMAALDAFMDAFNARDAAAWAATLNYPHVRIADGEVRVWDSAAEYEAYMDFDRFVKQTGWDHSEWDERTVVQSDADKVHVAVRFSRYDASGTKIATYESMYVMTNKDGHWGTQARSSFAP